jgi:hypothetical protein
MDLFLAGTLHGNNIRPIMFHNDFMEAINFSTFTGGEKKLRELRLERGFQLN